VRILGVELYDLARLASTVGVDAVMTDQFPDFSKTWQSVTADLVAALLAALIVLVVTEAVLTRPRLKVDWLVGRVPQHGPELVADFTANPSYSYEVSLNYTAESLVAKRIGKSLRNRGLSLTLELDPVGAVEMVGQFTGSSTGVLVSGNRIRFECTSALRTGVVAWTDVRLSPDQSSSSMTLICSHTTEAASIKPLLLRLLLPVSPNIQRIAVIA